MFLYKNCRQNGSFQLILVSCTVHIYILLLLFFFFSVQKIDGNGVKLTKRHFFFAIPKWNKKALTRRQIWRLLKNVTTNKHLLPCMSSYHTVYHVLKVLFRNSFFKRKSANMQLFWIHSKWISRQTFIFF